MKEGAPNDIEAQIAAVEEFEAEISKELGFDSIEQTAKDDLLARIKAKIVELKKNPEPLLSEGCVLTLEALQKEVFESPVRTQDDDMDDLYEKKARRPAEDDFREAA